LITTLDQAATAAKYRFFQHSDTPDQGSPGTAESAPTWNAYFHSEAAADVARGLSAEERWLLLTDIRAVGLVLTPAHPSFDFFPDDSHGYTLGVVEQVVIADAIQTLLQRDEDLMNQSRRRGELADNWAVFQA
jgi:hypothetical protein